MSSSGPASPTASTEVIDSARTATEVCPWCGSSISRVKFQEIQDRIRAEERRRLAEQEVALKKQLEQHEVEIRKQLLEDSERKLKVALFEADRKRQEELAEQRQSLEKDRDVLLLKQKAEFNREREAHQKKLREMERQLERKTANELGDGAEIDLFEALKEAFRADHIKRIQKGTAGADIIQEVMYKEAVCGRIIFDSKNRQGWQNTYVVKLREDWLAAKADHAVLATTVFPSGKKELCIDHDVIIASPARVVYVVQLLRTALIRMHQLGLSTKERQTKMSAVYAFITSDSFAQRMREAQKMVQDVLGLDVDEQEAHQKVWKARGKLATRLRTSLNQLNDDIIGLVEGSK